MAAHSLEIASPVTWRILETTSNQAATSLLVRGLSSPSAAVRQGCLRSLIARKDPEGFRQLLLCWDQYDNADIDLLRSHARYLVTAARSLLASDEIREKKFALAAITELDITDSIDILMEFVLGRHHPLHDAACYCLLSMSHRLGRDSRLVGHLDSPLRLTLIKKLHGELLRHCEIPVVMEAWLTAVHWDDGAQRGLLLDPSQSAYLRMVSELATSNESAALQLLAGYFWRSTTPPSILSLIHEHLNPQLFIEMAKLVSDEQLDNVLCQLQSSPPLACLKNFDWSTIKFERSVERRLMLMYAASGHDLAWTLSTCVKSAKGGNLESRKLAADLLVWCKRPSLEQFIQLLQADSLLPVDQQILNLALNDVVSWLHGPSTVLRTAVAHFLQEFSLENLFSHVGHWPARLCRIMAQWLKKMNPPLAEKLHDYLSNPAPKNRVAALQVVEWLDCMDIVEDKLLEMLHDPRLEVRVQLIDTLSALNDNSLENLLPALRQDANTDIVDAANRAQRRLDRRKSATSAS